MSWVAFEIASMFRGPRLANRVTQSRACSHGVLLFKPCFVNLHAQTFNPWKTPSNAKFKAVAYKNNDGVRVQSLGGDRLMFSSYSSFLHFLPIFQTDGMCIGCID